jgi:hypothetical protein
MEAGVFGGPQTCKIRFPCFARKVSQKMHVAMHKRIDDVTHKKCLTRLFLLFRGPC